MAGRKPAGSRRRPPASSRAGRKTAGSRGAPDSNTFLAQDAAKDLLRFCTAGSVDDGKSTLIGRLLYDSKLVCEDHLGALQRDSAQRGSVAGGIDYALLLDGLRAERESNITIDVAYRYFATPRRKFIIADTPGHEQYTRNMVTGASTSDAAVVLVDAQAGVVTQTRRHLFLMSLLGLRHVIVAVNKMDLVGYAEAPFRAIVAELLDFAQRLDIPGLSFIPVAALHGENITQPSALLPWYQGPTLLAALESLPLTGTRNFTDLRFPVQLVLRPHQNFRGYAGTVASGIIRRGDEIMVLPSGQRSTVADIHGPQGKLAEAFAGQAVTVTLTDERDVSRGCMLVRPLNVPQVTTACEALLVWLAETPLRVGAQYLIKHTTSTVPGEIAALRYAIDVNTLHRRDAATLGLNDIGRVAMRFTRPLFTDPYARNRATGAFIVIDRATNATVGAGMVLDRPVNRLQPTAPLPGAPRSGPLPDVGGIATAERARRLGQQPCTLWLTGLPRSGKTPLAVALERALFDLGYTPHLLAGSALRRTLAADLGFTADDRRENVRRGAALARYCNDLGLITLAVFASPYAADRTAAKAAIGAERFLEVHCNAPRAVCAQRDPELYARAERGEVEEFTGISSPYEPPAAPDFVFAVHEQSVDTAVAALLELLRTRGFIS